MGVYQRRNNLSDEDFAKLVEERRVRRNARERARRHAILAKQENYYKNEKMFLRKNLEYTRVMRVLKRDPPLQDSTNRVSDHHFVPEKINPPYEDFEKIFEYINRLNVENIYDFSHPSIWNN